MYEKNLNFRGIHATYMKKLAAKFSSDLSQGLFKRNLDVYLIAPIVGKLYNRKSPIDTDVDDSTSIHTEQMNEVMDQLEFNYRTIMLLEGRDSVDLETRIDKAFRYDRNPDKRADGDKVFEEYVRGGIEVLYEKLMEGTSDSDEYLKKAFQFVSDFNQRYADTIDVEEIYKMCKMSSN